MGARAGEPSFEVEAPVVLGALDDLAFHQAVGQMGIAVGANPVGGMELAIIVAHQGKGLASRNQSE
jgi:hypothetical protein